MSWILWVGVGILTYLVIALLVAYIYARTITASVWIKNNSNDIGLFSLFWIVTVPFSAIFEIFFWVVALGDKHAAQAKKKSNTP